jgi:hypothetical protein
MALTSAQVTTAVNRYAASRDFTGLQNYLATNGATIDQAANAGVAYNAAVAAGTGNRQRDNLDFKNNFVESIKATFKAQISDSKISELGQQDKVNADDYVNFLKSGLKTTDLIKAFGGDILQQIKNEEQLRTDINETLGITRGLSEQVRNTITETTTGALKFGFGMKNVSDMFTAIAETTGRANFMSVDTAEKTYSVARAFVGSLSDVGRLIGEMEKIGLGAADSISAVEKAGRSSLSLGLNTKKTTELLKGDLSKINEYGFKNGIEGLNRMVQKSLEFRMNLGEVYKIADKVMNPDGAIELTANLQVLGGAIGDFNDPMKLMYMATNNVEGLQDALIGAAGGLATFNQEQGRFEITGVNLRRAKEMAAQMGIEYKEFAKGAIAVQERLSVVQDLAGKGFNLNEKDQEFISNLSQMKDGRMVLSVPKDVADKIGVPIETAVSELTQTQINLLTSNRKELEKMDSEQIAREQFSLVKNLDNNVQSLANRQFRALGTQARTYANDLNKTQMKDLMDMATDAAKSASLNSSNESEIADYFKGLTNDVRNFADLVGASTLTNETMQSVKNQFNKIIEEEKVKKYNQEREKQELKTRPGQETSFNTNNILKSKIDITFPFGYGGLPSAEQQGSYLVTV